MRSMRLPTCLLFASLFGASRGCDLEDALWPFLLQNLCFTSFSVVLRLDA